MRGGGATGVTLEVSGSIRGRFGVDAENVGSLTPNAKDEELEAVGFPEVMVNASEEDLEGECAGDFDGEGSVMKFDGGC